MMIRKYVWLALVTSLVFMQQNSNAIHLKDKDGNFVAYEQEKHEITMSKDETRAAHFKIMRHFEHDKDKHLPHSSKSKNGEKKEHHKHFKLMLNNHGCSVLFPMGWNGTELFVPHKHHEKMTKQDEPTKSKSKKAHSKKQPAKKHHKKDWKKFGKMLICKIEGIEVTPDTTDEQLDEHKVVFKHREGKKVTTKELFFEKGAKQEKHHEEAKKHDEPVKHDESVKTEKQEAARHEEASAKTEHHDEHEGVAVK